MFSEFRSFLTKSNALALAVGVVLGVALGAVVASLVNDIIMPPIGLALGGVDFDQLQIVLKEGTATTDPVAIRYGTFLSALLTFVIVAFVVFLIARWLLPKPGPTRTCPFCHEEVSVDATRCRFCTSELSPEPAAA
jgi:large conductance mechanosensitive channel